jgi:hypothetical protein
MTVVALELLVYAATRPPSDDTAIILLVIIFYLFASTLVPGLPGVFSTSRRWPSGCSRSRWRLLPS